MSTRPSALAFLVGFGLLLSSCASDDAPSLSASASSIDFGVVPVGQQGTNSVSLNNESDLTITVRQPELSGPRAQLFSVANQSWPVDIAAGSSFLLEVLYSPLEAGDHGAVLTVPATYPGWASSGDDQPWEPVVVVWD